MFDTFLKQIRKYSQKYRHISIKKLSQLVLLFEKGCFEKQFSRTGYEHDESHPWVTGKVGIQDRWLFI